MRMDLTNLTLFPFAILTVFFIKFLNQNSFFSSMNYDNLVERAEQKLSENMDKIDKIHTLGLHKELHMGNKSSQIVVTYPSVDLLDEFNGDNFLVNSDGLNTLYIHIPFCTGICTYCNYARTAASEKDKRISEYMDYLDKESAMFKSILGEIQVQTIYIGGGTPTLLSEDNLERLFKVIKRDYKLDNDVEFTIEGSPETVTVGKIALAKHYGVNRVSIGIESFNDGILESIGRRHDSEGAYEALEKIRKAGIDEIDFDLIRGLPNYTLDMVVNDIKGVERAKVPSVTSYQYSLKPLSLDAKRLPKNVTEQLLPHLVFMIGMQDLGYIQSPIDWFVKDESHLYKHQMLKWHKMANQLVLGQSSYGFFNGVQFANFKDRKAYGKAIKEGRLPIERATKLSFDDMMRRRFLFGLKTKVDRDRFRKIHGVDPTETSFGSTLNKLIEAGAITADDSGFSISDVGVLFADWIQMAFYSDGFKKGF